MKHRDKYKSLRKKGHIKEKRARQFINELLNAINMLELENQNLRHEKEDLTTDPGIMVFRQLFARLDNIERKMDSFDMSNDLH